MVTDIEGHTDGRCRTCAEEVHLAPGLINIVHVLLLLLVTCLRAVHQEDLAPTHWMCTELFHDGVELLHAGTPEVEVLTCISGLLHALHQLLE